MTPRARHPLICIQCNKDFSGYRKGDKYCSDTCRYAWQHWNRSQKSIERRRLYQKKWGTENWLRRRNYMITYTYGITPGQYQELLERQNYSCATCGRHETEFGRKLAVDHDHKTGEIYGLLCQTCNHVLIGKYRDPKIFEAAAKYLKQGTGWIIPPKIKKKRRGKTRHTH